MEYRHSLRLATNADIPRLPKLLEERSYLVQLLNPGPLADAMNNFYQLSLIARGPYAVLYEDGCFVIHGFDRVSGSPAKARIVDGVFEFINDRYLAWGESPRWLRLYVPDD